MSVNGITNITAAENYAASSAASKVTAKTKDTENKNKTVQMASTLYDRYLSPIFVKRANAKD